jgi:hypothetical protein
VSGDLPKPFPREAGEEVNRVSSDLPKSLPRAAAEGGVGALLELLTRRVLRRRTARAP